MLYHQIGSAVLDRQILREYTMECEYQPRFFVMVTRRYMNRNGRYTAKRYQKGLVRFCLAFWYGRLLDINAMWGPISSNFQKLRRIIQ